VRREKLLGLPAHTPAALLDQQPNFDLIFGIMRCQARAGTAAMTRSVRAGPAPRQIERKE
jgi:hypothetical protein